MFEKRENVLLRMVKLLLVWFPDQQAKGDNVNSSLIRQKVKRIFDNLQ
jgi:hypothetical protein